MVRVKSQYCTAPWIALYLAAALCDIVVPPQVLYAQNIQRRIPLARLELVRRIGAETGAPEYSFGFIRAIATFHSRILVLDSYGPDIKVYDSTGTFLFKFGRQGAGPGELMRPVGIITDSLIHVMDIGTSRVTSYDDAGRTVATKRLPGFGLNITRAFRFGKSFIGVTTPTLSPGRAEHQPNVFVVFYLPDGEGLDTLVTYRSGATVWYTPGSIVPWGGVHVDWFGDGGSYAVTDTLMALVDGYEGTVTWYIRDPEGKPVAKDTSHVPFESRPVKRSDIRQVKRVFREYRDSIGYPVKTFELETPPKWSVATYAFFDARGLLWVRNGTDAAEHTVWTVFGSDRRVLRKVVFPRGFHLMHADGRLLYGTWRTEGGASVVRIYRLLEE